MMEKNKIYTRTGDKGYTSLVGGKRVLKTHPRIEAYGTLDELSAAIACLMDLVDERNDRELLRRIQYNLFNVCAYLASDNGNKFLQLVQEEIIVLEEEMDKIEELLPPLRSFILPGGCPANSQAHVCRTVCRRAERCICRLTKKETIEQFALQYINRLSDYFFLFSRKQNLIHHIDEITWNKPCI